MSSDQSYSSAQAELADGEREVRGLFEKPHDSVIYPSSLTSTKRHYLSFSHLSAQKLGQCDLPHLIGSTPRRNCSYVVSHVKGTVTLPNALIRGIPQRVRGGISCDTVEPAEITPPSPTAHASPPPHT